MRSTISTKMNIPATINVGFQNRSDTYTKKLAYVVYTDAKGVLRKQTSWDNWRDSKIKPLEFKNEPTSGFVLNKNVGGYKSGWNHRNAYIRIYDPRDFEFEITLENLLFILQETSAIKGKGLEGEFVYSWDGKDLVLLPVDSAEYKECFNFTTKQTKKVTKDQIKEGHSYLMKDMTNVMYLGKLPYSNTQGYGENMQYVPVGKHHIFVNLDAGRGEDRYIPLSGYTKLAEVTSTDTAQFASKFTTYKKSPFHKIATGIEFVPKKVKISDFGSDRFSGRQVYRLEKHGNKYCPIILHRYEEQGRGTYKNGQWIQEPKTTKIKKYVGPATDIEFDGIGCDIPKFQTHNYNRPYGSTESDSVFITEEQLLSSEFYTVELISNKGRDDLLLNGFRY